LLTCELAGLTVAWFFFNKLDNKMIFYLDNSLKNVYNGTFVPEADDVGFSYSSGGSAITLAWDTVQLQVIVLL